MTVARFLPTLSVNAGYTRPFENDFYGSGGNWPNASTDAYYTYGFRLTMPLDINTFSTIESARLDAMAAAVAMQDKRREADNAYEAAMKRLAVIKRMIALSKEDEQLYDSLVASTKEKVDAGEMTVYDLKTMENSKRVRQLDQKIFEIQRQLVLLDLYEKSYADLP